MYKAWFNLPALAWFHWSGGGGKGGFKNDSYEAAAASLINTPGRPVAHTPFVAAMFGIGGDFC